MGGASTISFIWLVWILKKLFWTNKEMETVEERTLIVKGFDHWIYKSVFWYLCVIMAFAAIMLDTGSNLLISLIASGITTFTLILWWRTTFQDFIEILNPYKVDRNRNRR